ncbi:MAG: DUF2007 domain-containing protein [Clostridia bacterium]|nr:DUF2007 domain-containing protein [Clostridia bacterium]
MIHVFNRKELITVFSDQKLYKLRTALSEAGIQYKLKNNTPIATAGRYHGAPFINSDASHPCVIFVKASDYERAKSAIQSALRD